MNNSDFDPAFQSQNTESKIVAALERLSQAFRVLLWQESKDYSLSPIQVQVLIFLLFHGENKRRVSYLASEFNMTKATISDTVKALEQKELIRKKSEAEDTRSYTIHLTKKGKEIANKTSLFSKEIKEPIDKLHNEDKENLLISLMGIINHLQKTGVITVQRMCSSCSYYQSAANGQTHYCGLLNKSLQPAEPRIDCPEHELKQ
jgi:DNA-binding MarR family transcriptional regulator